MQQRFLLRILLLARRVSGTTMPIIMSSRVLYSGCCLWYFVLWFSSCWSGVELSVMCPVCRMLQSNKAGNLAAAYYTKKQKNYSFEYNQQDALLYNIFYYFQCSTCFRRFLRPSSGAQPPETCRALTIIKNIV